MVHIKYTIGVFVLASLITACSMEQHEKFLELLVTIGQALAQGESGASPTAYGLPQAAPASSSQIDPYIRQRADELYSKAQMLENQAAGIPDLFCPLPCRDPGAIELRRQKQQLLAEARQLRQEANDLIRSAGGFPR